MRASCSWAFEKRKLVTSGPAERSPTANRLILLAAER